jgi:ATP-dependent helicase/nuclease subunit A
MQRMMGENAMFDVDSVQHPSPPAPPPDHAERSRALDPAQSFLVQAPAGSGKTYLLTQRFLRLLALAEKPDEIVAITFTNAAAAEMRNRVLDALAEAEGSAIGDNAGPESLAMLARQAMERSHQLGWNILDQPSQLRITTIDAFCRGLALQSPLSWGLLSGLGGELNAVENPADLYRRAATRTLELVAGPDSQTRRSLENVLLWRDNNWKDVEQLLIDMLAQRNRWYQEFVFARNENWPALRLRLEAPFCRGARRRLEALGQMLDALPGSREFALDLARFACTAGGTQVPTSLAERAELPVSFDPSEDVEEAALLSDAAEAYRDLACFLQTAEGAWRKKGGLNKNHGFHTTVDGAAAKNRFTELVDSLREEPGLEAALAAFCRPMPVRYTDEEWELMKDCFAVLRVAFVELQTVFAETGSVDFTEVAQIALRILQPENGIPSEIALRQADSIHHLLIDEFQDTSRNQHELLARLIAAWPEREGRSCFCVGDPMQSIYGFREAEVELFERTRNRGLEIFHGFDADPFKFEPVALRANFRTAPSLIEDLNGHFARVFAEDDGSGVRFFPVEAARPTRVSALTEAPAKTVLHLAFTRSSRSSASNLPPHLSSTAEPEQTQRAQLDELIALIRDRLGKMDAMRNAAGKGPRADSGKYRIAVLGRTKKSLTLVAEALQEASIAFRAIDLVKLRERTEVLDALALMRALLNPVDRTAWLGVLRAPWCGLSLEELHLLTSADDTEVIGAPVPVLLEVRLAMLFETRRIDSAAFAAASRVAGVMRSAAATRPEAAASALGTWVESVWLALGGNVPVDAEQRQNLGLLWAALDKLPQGELDLVGPGLDAALDKLYALPDPAASGDFGVQLMTIHKSKGLEFEVVIVPDLEAEGRSGERAMISWLERGLTDAVTAEDGSPQLTEFLIAPIQTKGADAGAAKKWVDAVKKERDRQELRRLLYVAATRARDELHLFARPRFGFSKSQGGVTLANATGLLATAWPSLAETVEAEFAAWLDARAAADDASSQDAHLPALAAAGTLVEMPSPQPATHVRRLPENFSADAIVRRITGHASGESSELLSSEEDQPLYARTEGGLQSRLAGSAIHLLLEHLSRLRQTMSRDQAAVAVEQALPGIIARIRSHGLPAPAAQRLGREALSVVRACLIDTRGDWILAPHPKADTESHWTGLVQPGSAETSQSDLTLTTLQLRNLRPDRVFFDSPLSAADAAQAPKPVWWIIDYKTSHAGGADLKIDTGQRAFLSAHRERHGGQLAAYAQVLRGLTGSSSIAIRAGLYYPRLLLFDSWDA